MQAPSTRIPNLGHALLFLILSALSLVASEAAVLAIAHPHPLAAGFVDQRLQLIANILTYAVVLLASWFVYPLLWRFSFPEGIRWHAGAARPRLIALGLLLGFVSQAISSLLPTPAKLPIEDIFHNPAIIWIVVVFGTLVAPLFEEILFRGFLLPAFAIAVDYLRLPKDVQALDRWRAEGGYSAVAVGASSLLTSLLFALIHAPQLGFSWPAVALLAAVSLILCAIRLRTGSVAASTLVHATYNFSVFLTIFFATHGFRQLDRV